MSARSSRTSSDIAHSGPAQDKILTLSFNQDSTALTMGTRFGYFLFNVIEKNSNVENHAASIKSLITAKYVPFEEVRIIERVLNKSFIAIVSEQAPRKLNVLDIKRGKELHTYRYATNITAVRISRSRLVVCLTEEIWIHDMRDLKVIHIIRELPANNNGLCALSSSDDSPYLTFPKSLVTGEIQVFDTIKLKDVCVFHAHDSPIVAMVLDISGARIATASTKGTVIRVHSTFDGSRLFEFRRGVQRAATIYSLAFSPDFMFLSASSNTGTIHIFRLITAAASASQISNTWMSTFGRMIKGAAVLLPQQTADVLTQDRSFATVHLSTGGLRTHIAMNNVNNKLVLFVADYDGMFFTYEVNTIDGKECKQLSQCNLFELYENSKNEQRMSMDAGNSTTDEPIGDYPPNIIRNPIRSASQSSTSTNENGPSQLNQKTDMNE